MTYLIETKDGISLNLHIQPGASRSEIAGLHGDRIKIRLNAPPVEGKANKELIAFLSKQLGISKRDIEIIRGETNRSKTIKIIGITKDKLTKLLKIE